MLIGMMNIQQQKTIKRSIHNGKNLLYTGVRPYSIKALRGDRYFLGGGYRPYMGLMGRLLWIYCIVIYLARY